MVFMTVNVIPDLKLKPYSEMVHEEEVKGK